MKKEHRKSYNMNSLETQCTLSDLGEQKLKIHINLPKKPQKLSLPNSVLQISMEQSAIKLHTQSLIAIPQLLTQRGETYYVDDECLKKLIDCTHIEPITMKEMSRCSRNELQDINCSLMEINVPVAQKCSSQVACNTLQNKYQNEDMNNYEGYIQSQTSRQKISLQMYYEGQQLSGQYLDKNRLASHKFSLFKKALVEQNEKNFNNQTYRPQIKPNELKVIPTISNKKFIRVQNQEASLHQKELNYLKAKPSVKLKDYLYQSQISSKIKLLKRKQAKQMRKYQKKQLSSSFNSQQVSNPVKKVDEKDRKCWVKSGQILQVVKVQILNEFQKANSIMQKISNEMIEVEKCLQVPKDEDLWRIFELKRNIDEQVTTKLNIMLEEIRNRRVVLQRKQKK